MPMTELNWTDLVRSDAVSWNEARAARPKDRPDLSHQELFDIDFRGFDFGNAILDDVRFEGCDLTGCSFVSATCQRMSAVDTKLGKADFSRANLNHADFSNGLFKGGKYRGGVAVIDDDVGIDLREAKFQNTKMSHGKFWKADFRGAALSKAVLKGADARSADFRGAEISACNFSQSNLTGALLQSVNLTKSKFNGTNFRRAFLEKSIFIGTELQGAVLRNAIANGASFSGCDLRSVDLKGGQFSGADFSEVMAEGVDFSRTNLCGSRMASADLTRANLIEAILDAAEISGVRLWEAQISGWSIKGVVCTEAYWDREGTEPTFYEIGEFERQHGDAERIELIYRDGISRVEVNTLPLLVQHLEGLHEGCLLRLKSIEDAPGGSKVTIVIDEAGDLDASALKVTIQEEAGQLQVALKRLEQEKRLREMVERDQQALQNKVFPILLEMASKDVVRNQGPSHSTAAALFMDLTGFSKLVEAERAEALAMLQGLLKPLLARWNAAHPNMWGDALRATFEDVNDALGCACAMQAVLGAADLKLRIGMDFGEIVETFNPVLDEPDIQGDIVNMAARLEPLAPVGGVLVTDNLRFNEAVDPARFKFEPTEVSMKKAVGDIPAGASITCYVVSTNQELLVA